MSDIVTLAENTLLWYFPSVPLQKQNPTAENKNTTGKSRNTPVAQMILHFTVQPHCSRFHSSCDSLVYLIDYRKYTEDKHDIPSDLASKSLI